MSYVQLTSELAKDMTVEELTNQGRFLLRQLACDLGLFTTEECKVAFMTSSTQGMAELLCVKLREKYAPVLSIDERITRCKILFTNALVDIARQHRMELVVEIQRRLVEGL